MILKTLSRHLWLLTTFRNGWKMLRTLRGDPPIYQANLFSENTIVHSQKKAGLLEAILELWLEKSYFPDSFYCPKPGDMIVDVGASIGLFTVQAAKLNPNSRIAAFEPFPENLICLSKNISNFSLKNVTLHQHAVGSHYEQGLVVETGDRSLDHRLIKQSEIMSETSTYVPVSIIALEGIFDVIKANEISFLKVDIEGAEQDVFESASEKTLKQISCIAIEYHDNIRPGTLHSIDNKLASTHHIKTISSDLADCGLLFAVRRA